MNEIIVIRGGGRVRPEEHEARMVGINARLNQIAAEQDAEVAS